LNYSKTAEIINKNICQKYFPLISMMMFTAKMSHLFAYLSILFVNATKYSFYHFNCKSHFIQYFQF